MTFELGPLNRAIGRSSARRRSWAGFCELGDELGVFLVGEFRDEFEDALERRWRRWLFNVQPAPFGDDDRPLYPATSLIEMRRNSRKPFANQLFVNHSGNIRRPRPLRNPQSSIRP